MNLQKIYIIFQINTLKCIKIQSFKFGSENALFVGCKLEKQLSYLKPSLSKFSKFFFLEKKFSNLRTKTPCASFFWEILKVMVILKSPTLIYLSSKFLWKIKIPLNSRAKLHNMGFFSLQIEKNYSHVWNQLLEIGQKSISNLCNEFLPRVWLFLRSRIHLF